MGNQSLTLREARRRIEELERENERLKEEVITDDLTKLFTRVYVRQRVEELLADLRRYNKRNLSIVFSDIDHFKKINDTMGHAGGDVVLRHFAEVLRAHVRTSDIAARLGGEEFLLVFPGATVEQARLRAEYIKKVLRRLHFGFNPDLVVTASFGVAQAKPNDTFETLVARADSVMYRAKQEGRNRVCVAD